MDPGAMTEEEWRREQEVLARARLEVVKHRADMPVQTVVPPVPTRIRLEGHYDWHLLLAVVVRVKATDLDYEPPQGYMGSLHRADLIYVTMDGDHYDSNEQLWFQILVGDEWCDVDS